MELAVRDGRIPSNPARGVKLRKIEQSDKIYLSAEQLHTLAACCEGYESLILTLGYCGLRWSEMAALKVGKVDLMHRRLQVAEAVTEVSGHLIWGTPKNHEKRWVPIPAYVADILAVQVAGKSKDDLVFATKNGKVLRNLNFRRDHFDAATIAAGLDGMTPHQLRDTCASLAVSNGANVLALSRMLGHKDPSVTLRIYAHLFDSDLDGVAERLNATARSVGPVRDAAVVELRG